MSNPSATLAGVLSMGLGAEEHGGRFVDGFLVRCELLTQERASDNIVRLVCVVGRRDVVFGQLIVAVRNRCDFGCDALIVKKLDGEASNVSSGALS